MPHQESEQICAEILKSLRPAQGIEASASLAGILKLLHNHETSELHDSIGQSVAGSLLQFFINPDEASGNDSSVRRWAGLVLSQLCLKSTSTATSLGAEHNASADLQGLGRVILSQTEGEDLKIVSGMIIKSLVKQCVDIGLCLPCDTPYDQFPAKDSDEWMLQFQDFLDAVLKGNLDLLSTADIFFPAEIADDEDMSFDDSHARIIMLAQNWLTIIISPTASYRTRCIDIPFSHILPPQPTEPSGEYTKLILKLKDAGTSSSSTISSPYFLDARGRHSKEVYLGFNDSEEATYALNAILRRSREAIKNSVHTTRFSTSQEDLDVSKTPSTSQPVESEALPLPGSASAALQARRSARAAGQHNISRQKETNITPMKSSEENARLGNRKGPAPASLPGMKSMAKVSNQDSKSTHQPATKNDGEDLLYSISPPIATSRTKLPQQQSTDTREDGPGPAVHPKDGIFLDIEMEAGATPRQPTEGKTNDSKPETTETMPKLASSSSLSSSRRSLPKNAVNNMKNSTTELEHDDSSVFDIPEDNEGGARSSRQIPQKESKKKNTTRSQGKSKSTSRRFSKKILTSSDATHEDLEDEDYQLSQNTKSAPPRTTRTTRSTAKRQSVSVSDEERAKHQPEQQQENGEDFEDSIADPQNHGSEKEPLVATEQSIAHINGNGPAQQKPGNSQDDPISLNSDVEPESELSPSPRPELPPVNSAQAKSIVGTPVTKERHRMLPSDKELVLPPTPIQRSQKKVREPVEVPMARKPPRPTTPAAPASLSHAAGIQRIPIPKLGKYVEESVETPMHSDRPIVNNYLTRKSTIINFGPRGPVNQGRLPRKGSVAPTPHAPPSRVAYGSTRSQKQKSKFSELIDYLIDDTTGPVEQAPPAKSPSPKREPTSEIAHQDLTKLVTDKTRGKMPIANFNDAPPFNEKPRPTETVTKPSVLEQRKRVNREATPQLAANYPNIIRTTGTKSLQALSEYLDGIEKENSSNKKTQPKTTNHKKRAASLASNSPLAKRRSQGPGLPVREPKHGLSALISQVNPLEEDTTSAPITHTHLALLAKDTQENPVPKPKRPERRFIDPGLFTSPKRGISRRHSLTKVDWHGSPIQTGPQAPQESQILQRYEEQAAADNGQFGDRIETGDDASDSSPPPFQHLKYAGSGTLITPKIMSSNRKRLPGSPLAESTAISGHMPQQLLNKASMLAPTDESSNPFTQQAHKAGEITPDTDFMKSICRPAGVRRVKFVEPIPKEDRISPPVRGILWPKTLKALPAEPDEGPDKTLVGEEDEDLEKTLVDEENEASPCTLMISDDSSPELTSDPTTASSEQEDDPLAAEMEWEASLPPHQQDMVTILTRLSRHLVRNLIDKETAIHDIVAEYERVATAIVDNMEQKHKREYTEKRALVHEASAKVGRRFGEIEQRMGRELKEAERACRGVERGWEERLKEGEELVKGLRGMWERFEE